MENKNEIKILLFNHEFSFIYYKEITLKRIKIDLGLKLGLVSKHYDNLTINFSTENQNFSHTLPLSFFNENNIEVRYILDSVPGISLQLLLDKIIFPK
jgi:hypothetical protein